MKVFEEYRTIELTRRNLLTLLAKLDGNPDGSSCTIGREGWWIKAVEDSVHYSDRPAGQMDPETERAIRNV